MLSPVTFMATDDPSLTMTPDTFTTVGNPAPWIGFTVLVLRALDLRTLKVTWIWRNLLARR